jgi:hypothetical protein
MTYSSGILIILFICRSPFGKLEFAQSRFGLTRNIIHLYSTAFFFFITMHNLTETGKMFKEDSKFLSHGGISIIHPWSY